MARKRRSAKTPPKKAAPRRAAPRPRPKPQRIAPPPRRQTPRRAKTPKTKPLKEVASNPGSRHYAENRAYQRHRGFFHKDRTGRWRTPDGKIVKGQKTERVDIGDGRYVDVFVSKRAWDYNRRRSDQLAARDITNAGRRAGVRVKVSEARDTVRVAVSKGVQRREAGFDLLRQTAAEQGRKEPLAREFARPRYRRWRPGRSRGG